MATDIFAQRRMDYETLRQRDRTPNVFFDLNVLPPAEGQLPELITSFKIEYNYLRFQRVRESNVTDESKRFVTDLQISADIQKIDRESFFRRSDDRSRRRSNTTETNRVGSMYWDNEIFTSTYEQTQSRTQFVNGMLSHELEPGYYQVIITVSSDGRTRGSVQRRIHIPDFSESKKPLFYLLDETDLPQLPSDVTLVNVGNNVYYGKDFTSLIAVPNRDVESDYKLEIKKAEVSERDTTTTNVVFNHTFSPDDFHINMKISQSSDTTDAILSLTPDVGSTDVAMLKVPNQTFANSYYRMTLTRMSDNTVTGSTVFQNRWFDMPVSLLNVDVAIQMLRFIVDDQKLNQLRRGSEREKEQKFREFWEERNPTPDTEYNELMVEYYRRIDYAYENFTTPSTPGYNSDQGRVYITNGPPGRVERRFPGQQQTIEVWMYGNRQFIFRATSGFGDYELIDRR